MKTKLMTLFILLSLCQLANAQKEYRLQKSTGQLKLNLNQATIEGYDGKEIIISGKNMAVEEVDERAKGLVPISSNGSIDNTGLGLNVTQNGEDVMIKVATKETMGPVNIKVPQNMKVSFANGNSAIYINTASSQGDLVIKNLKGEIEVLTSNNKIRLENNTGPMNVKTVYGAIEAILSNEIKGPISIISVYDYVDITMPASTKANIELGTNTGKLYAGKEFNIDMDKKDNAKNMNFAIGYGSLSGSGNINNNVIVVENPARVATTVTGTGGKSDNVQVGKVSSSVTSVNNTEVVVTNAPVAINANAFTVNSVFNMGERIKGKLNGGGIELIFKSTNKNVYLRQP